MEIATTINTNTVIQCFWQDSDASLYLYWFGSCLANLFGLPICPPLV